MDEKSRTTAFVLVVLFVSSVDLYVYDGDQSVDEFTFNIDPNDPFGVYNWPLTYPESCAGTNQSPVDINTSYVRYNSQLPCPAITYRTLEMTGQLKNNGQTLKFTPWDSTVLSMTNTPYRPGTYVLHGFHLHYGGHYSRTGGYQSAAGELFEGAEHTIDGFRFAGEIHLVFKNLNHGLHDPGVFTEEDGLAVVAVFVQVLPDHMVQDMRFSDFVAGPLQSIKWINDTNTITVDVSMFFGPSCDYYTYPGSKTTPSCSENVRWIILDNPVQVSQSAWYTLSNIRSRGQFVWYYGNYRNAQPINMRVVETNIIMGTQEMATADPHPWI